MTFSAIEGAYLSDLLGQGGALRRVVARLATTRLDGAIAEDLAGKRFRRVVVTGMGSSLHAAYPFHRALSAAGIESHWIETAELLLGFGPLYREDTLLVAISQSGESAEIVHLMSSASRFGAVIGVTNNEHSALGRAANQALLLEAGAEAGVSCKTYLATLAVLHWLAAQITGGDVMAGLKIAEEAVDAYLGRWREHVEDLLPLLDEVTSIFVTGRGDSLATAGTGGLILKESTRLHAEGMSAAAFRHGPLEMASQHALVLIFEGDEVTRPLHRRLAEDIRRAGGKAALIGPDQSEFAAFRLPAGVGPILEILPVQMISLAIGARDGFEPGRFKHASKITSVA